MEKPKEYELMRTVGIERDFIEKLLPVLAFIGKPIQGTKEKMRVVIDYDPQAAKTEFRYYRLNGG